MKHKILGLLAVGLLAGSTGAHAASLTGDSVACSFTGTGSSCQPAIATVSEAFEFLITGPGGELLLRVNILEQGLVFFDAPSTVGFSSDTFVLSDLDFSDAPDGLTGVTVGPEWDDSMVSFTPDSLTLLFQGVLFLTGDTLVVRLRTDPQSVPEPDTLALLGLGLLGLGVTRRRAN